jgi:hypothetical protein
MALLLVSDYLAAARILLQDLVQPYRYDDPSLVAAINMAFTEMDRIRPDIAMAYRYAGRVQRNRSPMDDSVIPFPTYTSASESTAVLCPPQYQNAVLYFVVGQGQLRDTEDTQDTRAAQFMQVFKQELLTLS